MQRFLAKLFSFAAPPFAGLSLTVLCYIALCHLLFPHNDVLRGNLPDPDDYMYLDQTLDWIKGQAFYDAHQYRLDPPNGVIIPFSRLVQMPLALGILFFKSLGLPLTGAATLTALIEPFFVLTFCFWAFRFILSSLSDPSHSALSSLVALFSPALLYEFMPGHVDHHGLVIALVLTSLGLTLRLIDHEDAPIEAIGLGVTLSVTLMVALEVLPWLLLLSLAVGLWSLYKRGKTLRSGFFYASSLVLASILCLLFTIPPSSFLKPDLLTYSVVYLYLAGAIWLPFAVAFGADNLLPKCTRVLGLAAALSSALLFLHFFPKLITGPYGDIDPQLIPLLLDNVEEAKPILSGTYGMSHAVHYLGTGFVGLLISLYYALRSPPIVRAKWALISLFLVSSLGLTLFYQYRFSGIESALAVLPLTVLLIHLLKKSALVMSLPRRLGLILLAVFITGPLFTLILPGVIEGEEFSAQSLLFPVDPGRSLCDMRALEGVLRSPEIMGDHTHLILSSMEMGPEILFRSPYQVLAAPFHLDVEGNLDAARFLSTPFEAEAKRIAERRGVDAVLLCRQVAQIYLPPTKSAPSFIETLFYGTPPRWLRPVSLPRVDNFILLRTDLTAQ